MQQNDELIKQLKFIADMYPKVFMNTSLGLAIAEIKKIIISKEQITDSSLKICPVCHTNPYSLNYPYKQGYICGDCYFDMLGDLVESHPVGRP